MAARLWVNGEHRESPCFAVDKPIRKDSVRRPAISLNLPAANSSRTRTPGVTAHEHAGSNMRMLQHAKRLGRVGRRFHSQESLTCRFPECRSLPAP